MRDRLLAFAGSLAVATVAVALTPHTLAAQAAKPAVAVKSVPPAMRPIATGRTRAKHM